MCVLVCVYIYGGVLCADDDVGGCWLQAQCYGEEEGEEDGAGGEEMVSRVQDCYGAHTT